MSSRRSGKVYIYFLTYPGVHEDEVHLAEGEDHLENGIDTPEHLVTRGIPGDLEEAAQLHAVVDHGAQPEAYKEVEALQ